MHPMIAGNASGTKDGDTELRSSGGRQSLRLLMTSQSPNTDCRNISRTCSSSLKTTESTDCLPDTSSFIAVSTPDTSRRSKHDSAELWLTGTLPGNQTLVR